MENYICYIFWITLLTGLFGGLVNFLLLDGEENLGYLKFFRSIVVGVAASFVVPLFLQTISSDLINQCKDEEKYYFIYTGFCLIASIFSKRFLDTVAERVIKQAEQAERNSEKALNIAIDKSDKVQAFVDRNTEPDEEIDFGVMDIKSVELVLNDTVGDDIKKILAAFKNSKYTYRTAKGISKEIKAEQKIVERILDELVEQKMVKKFTNSQTQKVLWTLTEIGNKYRIQEV